MLNLPHMTSRPRAGFDVVPVLLVSAFVGVVVWGVTRPDKFGYDIEGESRRLGAVYGPDTNSEAVEEWAIRDFFGDRRGGFFLDVGAADYRAGSNTYFLETALAWEGIAVEALSSFGPDYERHRPRTKFRSFFVSDRSNELAKLFVLKQHTPVSSSDKTFTERWGKDSVPVEIPTITLNDLLAAEGVTRIDFLSMDIELSEPQALAGFDVGRFRPALVCIEAHAETRQAILDYFATNGYVVVGKYLRADLLNLYFKPRGGSGRRP